MEFLSGFQVLCKLDFIPMHNVDISDMISNDLLSFHIKQRLTSLENRASAALYPAILPSKSDQSLSNCRITNICPRKQGIL